MSEEKAPEQPSRLWSLVRASIIGRAINYVAGPFVDAQIVSGFQEYFPKARMIRHARTDVLHIETRLSHVTSKFVHLTFSFIIKDPQIEELCMAMELGGYKALIFGFTVHKVIWILRAKEFYLLDIEAWNNYRPSLENVQLSEIVIPDIEPLLPID